MQKSLIALAALATLSGAALAQSSVTIYGRLDASVGANKAGAPATAKSTSQLESGLLSTSRLGFRGTEDLGGGMRALFQLEGELKVDDGTMFAHVLEEVTLPLGDDDVLLLFTDGISEAMNPYG